MTRDFSTKRDHDEYIARPELRSSITDARGPGWANIVVGKDRMAQIGEMAHDLTPEKVRDAGRNAIHSYAEWITKPRGEPVAGLAQAENNMRDNIGHMSNRAAQATGQPTNYWMEHNAEADANDKRTAEAEGAPQVHQMQPIEVEPGGVISRALKNR